MRAAAELVGYLASALVFTTFYMKTLTPMRLVAIASNVAFISYGYLGDMHPILVLHSVLLPLNIWRLQQMRPHAEGARRAGEDDFPLSGLLPDTACRRFAPGETIFRKGEPAHELLLITGGNVRLTELQLEMGEGAIIGEIGVFSQSKTRAVTAVALTAVDAVAIAEDRIIAVTTIIASLASTWPR
jgi:CRP/FNR family transcriptional regulator, cyclic AMP receptor protein